ncbi:putative Ni/Fe-hydrogenase 1 B-type cytochrome subunit [bioreactor metagenome]|uniref:Putative Ni/Fe-hydrogenase 1 B-type cytochrome subunit n=1 Tax=bioreactor metagenome TaxID=1076179 RepID=A0A644T942_9ZZZZ|nr:Ni/Fe-hydrogenase, b-type cytochrome subunit [Negativicutes bacterium]
MSTEPLRRVYVFSPFLRLFHWIMVISIVVLFVTGLYIGNPAFLGTQGIEATYAVESLFSMATIRYLHFATAYIFVASFIMRIYGMIAFKGDRLFPRPWTFEYWLGTVDVALHYAFITPNHRPYIRNHMARAGYASVYVMILLEVITGFAMYYMIDPNRFGATLFSWINHLLINEYYVHLIHHYIAWFIVLFAIVHMYMAVRSDMMEKGGEISSMFSGVKFVEADPDDIGDIDHGENNSSRNRKHSASR